jgi:hypothetical protein
MGYFNSETFRIVSYDSLILVTENIRQLYHGVFKKARHEKITAKRLNARLWYVARKTEGHGEYLVRFHEVPQINGEDLVYVSCNSVDGDRCKGTLRQKRHFQNPMCVHIATAIDRGIQYGQRKAKLETKEAA